MSERARSLSPTKSASNAGTPTSLRSPTDFAATEDDISRPPNDAQQVSTSVPPDGIRSPPNLPELPAKPVSLSNLSSTAEKTPSRVGTLAWQQRPTSRGSAGTRTRPLSIVATENSAAKSPRMTADTPTAKEDILPRNQITQRLESKNPAWFKQTQDRGVGSAAYRRNHDDSTANFTPKMDRMRLPGLSRESSQEPEKELNTPSESLRSPSPSMDESMLGNSGGNEKHSSSTSVPSIGSVRSPLPTLRSQRFEPPLSDTSSLSLNEPSPSTRALAMSPSQGRISPERKERSLSPTKGLGGFVQSAMLKRSDSINKRWSTQARPGLSRGNSVASNRSGYDESRQTGGGISPSKESRSDDQYGDDSAYQKTRPTSSHSNATVTGLREENEASSNNFSSTKEKSGDIGFTKPAIPQPQKATSAISSQRGTDEEDLNSQIPSSPSKRWSPTKASWLESAIQKPDSPKPKAPVSQQPTWMANISKARMGRSVDLGKNSGLKEVSAEGLIQPPPPGSLKKPRTFEGGPKYLDSSAAISPVNKKTDETISSGSATKKASVQDSDSISKSAMTAEEPSMEKSVSTPNSPALSASGSIGFKSQTLVGSPSSIKSKPETPPKRDFRSNLKPRKNSVEEESKEEVEFKNVFGKLKRAQTQNYVAPDELKDNILRGKAGLAATGGPKKTERIDEFKESLLMQKEAMKSGPPSIPKKPGNASSTRSQHSPVPEAIAKRNGLLRSESNPKNFSASSRFQSEKPLKSSGGVAESKQLRDTPELEISSQQPGRLLNSQVTKGKLGDSFNSSLAGLISRGPSPPSHDTKSITTMNPSALISNTSTPLVTEEIPSGGTRLNHITKTRARGPKRRLPVAGKSDLSADPAISRSISSAPVEHLDLTAQGTNIQGDLPSIPDTATKSDAHPLASISNSSRKLSQPLPSRKPSTNVSLMEEMKSISPLSKTSTQSASSNGVKTSPSLKPKPSTHSIDGQLRKTESPSFQTDTKVTEELLQRGAPLTSPFVGTQPKSDRQISYDIPHKYAKNKPNSLGVQHASVSNNSVQGVPAVKPSVRENEKGISETSGLSSIRSSKASVGLGIQSTAQEAQRLTTLDPNLPSPPIRSPTLPTSPGSPPLPGKKPASFANRFLSGTYSSDSNPHPSKSQVPSNSEVSKLLAGVFGDFESSNPKINIDAQSVLASRTLNDGFDKIKTLRKQIWELTGNGKSIPVPSQQEHILFEESLYICTHVFGTLSGTRTTEIYLWVGSGVTQAAAEDAQIFARKVAKENGGKLHMLYQGKESSNFFQALGGIVITRRGSSTRGDSPSKATATYMLCGRRHVGQIAFDEVDFSASSLCKGFPFIVSARFGKLYLWKGSGASADELGCARLIGMDLGLTGEIEEVDEGQEPNAFWESLPGGSRDFTAAGNLQYWHSKPSCEKYATRLFDIDVEAARPKSSSSFNMWGRRGSAPPEENGGVISRVKETAPFTQEDVLRQGIHVLDSFFEVFV